MADTTVKGINIVFGADSEDFNKGLKKVNKELTQASKYGKTLQKSLNFDDADDGIQQLNKYLGVLETELKGNQSKADALRQEIERLDKAGELDNSKYLQLSDELTKAESNAEQLQRKISAVNSDIKSLDSGEFDKLSKTTQKAFKGMDTLDTSIEEVNKDLDETGKSFDTEQLSGDLKDLTGSAVEASGGVGALGKVFELGPELLNPYTLAIAGAGLAIQQVGEYSKDTREAQFTLTSQVANANVSMDDQLKVSRKLSRSLNMDMTEASQTVADAQLTYGDAISSTNDLIKDSVKISAYNASGLGDTETAYAVATQNAINFGLTTEQNEKFIGKLTATTQQFGQQGEDVNDTFIEWGDTFASTGQDADQMLGILNTGLLLGARSTDEVANAWNEFVLRLGDGTAQTAIEDIGLSWDDVVANFSKGGRDSQKAVIDVLDALSDVKDTTERTNEAAQIFGTSGEEFLATALDNKQAVKELNTEFDRQTKIQNNLTKATEKGSGTWQQMQKDLNLTNGEIADLQQGFKDYGLAGVDATTQSYILNSAVQNLGKSAGLTQPQIDTMRTAVGLLHGDLSLADTSAKDLNKGFGLLNKSGVITTSAMNDLQFTTNLLYGKTSLTSGQVNILTNNISKMGERGTYTQGQVNGLTGVITTLGDKSLTPTEKLDNLRQTVQTMGSTGQITTKDMQNYLGAINNLSDPSVSASKKASILASGVELVGTKAGLSKGEIAKYTDKINGASKAATNGTTKQDGFANKMSDIKGATANATSAIDRLTLAYIAQQSPTDRLRIKNALGADTLEDMGKSAGVAGVKIDGASGKITDLNGKKIKKKDVKITATDNASATIQEVDDKKIEDKHVNIFQRIFTSNGDTSSSSGSKSSGKSKALGTMTTNSKDLQPISVSVSYSPSNSGSINNDMDTIATEVSRRIARRLR